MVNHRPHLFQVFNCLWKEHAERISKKVFESERGDIEREREQPLESRQKVIVTYFSVLGIV